MEGARWDINIGSIVESRLKELHPLIPVMYIRAITQDKQVIIGTLRLAGFFCKRQGGGKLQWF